MGWVFAACNFAWSVVALKNTGGFLEFLLDRKTEFDKQVKYVKYEIVKSLAETPMSDVHTRLQLKTYVNNGPFYADPMMEVLAEGD